MYLAARISAREKISAFKSINIEIQKIYLSSTTQPNEMSTLITQLNQDDSVLSVIIQKPIPIKLQDSLFHLDPIKDIDGVNEQTRLIPACAAAEASYRIVSSFVKQESKIAVVGGKGFVGRGVINLLLQNNIYCEAIDINDSIDKIGHFDILVTATGQAGILNEGNLTRNHRLVVDVGFAPLLVKNRILALGDVAREAYPIPQRITPVPGGVGPMQVATLIERFLKRIDKNFNKKWEII